MTGLENIMQYLPEELSAALGRLRAGEQGLIREIRLRAHSPASVTIGEQSVFPTLDGTLEATPEHGIVVTRPMLEDTFLRLCRYSVHTHEHEISQGYLVSPTGDRAGICAELARREDGTLRCLSITSICLRVSREIPGCSRELLAHLNPQAGVLIAGAPGSGKTTLLRDMVRALASGETGRYYRIAVADERGELSANGNGARGKNLGITSDVLCGLTKGEAIGRAIRTLSPEIIACDEIGSEQEAAQLETGLCCGVSFLATVHCGSGEELFRSRRIRRLMRTGAFSTLVLLGSGGVPGRIEAAVSREDYDAQTSRTACCF